MALETKKYMYEDPTGAGDDAFLELAICFQPPTSILVTMGVGEDEAKDFMYLSEDWDEEKED